MDDDQYDDDSSIEWRQIRHYVEKLGSRQRKDLLDHLKETKRKRIGRVLRKRRIEGIVVGPGPTRRCRYCGRG